MCTDINGIKQFLTVALLEEIPFHSVITKVCPKYIIKAEQGSISGCASLTYGTLHLSNKLY